MDRNRGIILCLAFILGLLATAIPGGGYCVLALGIGAGILCHRRFRKVLPIFWELEPAPTWWLGAGAIGLLATFYFQARLPQPEANDISHFVNSNQQQIVQVQGRVISSPHVTRAQKVQFNLAVTQLNHVRTPVSGNLYVTLPVEQAHSIHPEQMVAVTGYLYKPKPGTKPDGFNFQAYLAKSGIFAGIKGQQVKLLVTKAQFQWQWWGIRQRIIEAQRRWLGNSAGTLLSAIVLGHQVVDLPYSIQDQFVQVGLAHALVASGFKVSLLLGMLLAVTQKLSAKIRFGLGAGTLVIYVALTGFHPPVCRAALMGLGALIALLLQRQRRPLPSLLLAATLLLIIQPLWIWDVGFELSFLATLGLIVTVPPLIKHLDWLPSGIAALVAVPLAAYLWTLPLMLHVFGVIAPYSIIVNILTTPLLSLVSVGGMLSAVAALIWSTAGSALAWLLYYPLYLLMVLVKIFCQLPGSSMPVHPISALQVCILYGFICLVWLQPWWQKRWWLVGFMAIGLVGLPVAS